MRIIARRTLLQFVERLSGRRDHAAVKDAVEVWYDRVNKARWRNAADVKQTFATASIVNAERIVLHQGKRLQIDRCHRFRKVDYLDKMDWRSQGI